MDFQYSWLLNLICYLPLVGALFMMAFINKENSSAIKAFATAVAALDFVISIPLWFLYRPDGAEFQFATQFDWIPSLGVQYVFGVDGISMLLILLTTLLGFIAIYCSWTAITERPEGVLHLPAAAADRDARRLLLASTSSSSTSSGK